MKATKVNTLVQQNNLENVIFSSPKRFERSPQLKFFRKPTYARNPISNVQDVLKGQSNYISPKKSFKGSDIGSFISNPQDLKERFLQQSNSAKALLITGGSRKQYLSNHNANQQNDHFPIKLQRGSQKLECKSSSNMGKIDEEDLKVLEALKQEIQRKKKSIDEIKMSSQADQEQSKNKYKQLQGQYQNAIDRIKQLEQVHNSKKSKNKKTNTSQIQKELKEKNAKLEKDIHDLQERYSKKMEECKYHEIQIGMLRKRKDQTKNSEYKLQKLTQKNKQLTKKIQGFKKQLMQVSSCKNLHGRDSKKRKDSMDSLFDLSSDHSVDRHSDKFY